MYCTCRHQNQNIIAALKLHTTTEEEEERTITTGHLF